MHVTLRWGHINPDKHSQPYPPPDVDTMTHKGDVKYLGAFPLLSIPLGGSDIKPYISN